MKQAEFLLASNLSSFTNVMFNHENISEVPAVHYQNLSDWGPKRDPLFIVIPFTVIFGTIFLTGLIGNISTCIVIARNKSMHTTTNYYLFSLAISDLLLLISGLPQEMYYIWSKYPYIFGEAFCVLQGFAAETSANATVLTITAFTVERYVAICHPFLSHTVAKLSRAIKLVIMIWIFAMCLAIPQAMAFGIVYEKDYDEIQEDDDHYICNVKRVVIPHAFLISTILFFVAPMSLITILYILIGLHLRQSTVGPVRGGSIKLNHLVHKKTSLVQYNNKRNQAAVLMSDPETASVQVTSQQEEERKNCINQSQAATQHVVKMLVAVVVAFFICWAPFHAQRLLAIYGQSDSSEMDTTFSVLTYISGVLYYLSTTINPVLYHIMSHKFRMAFKETLASCLMKQQQTRMPSYYLNMSRRSSQVNDDLNYINGKNVLTSNEPKFSQITNKDFKHQRKMCKSNRTAVYVNTELCKSSQITTQCKLSYTPGDEKLYLSGTDNSLNLNNFLNCLKSENTLARDNCKKLEEIEIFQEEQLCIKTIEKGLIQKPNRARRRSSPCKIIIKPANATATKIILTKSATVPTIKLNYCTSCLEDDDEKIIYSNSWDQTITSKRENNLQLRIFNN